MKMLMLIAALFMATTVSFASEMVLAEEGKSLFSIVLSSEACEEVKESISTSEGSVAAAPGRLKLMIEYLLRDVALLKAEAEGVPVAEREKMLDELRAFVETNADEGVILSKRFNHKRVPERYGLEIR